MWNIDKIVSCHPYQFAIIPNHPNRYKHNYVPLHRAIMENHINRLLTEDEVVHHKDENKLNNHIDNLELTTKEEHSKNHTTKRTRLFLLLKCPMCGKKFEILKNKFQNKISLFRTCSQKCGNKFGNRIKKEGITPGIQKLIDENIIKKYSKLNGELSLSFNSNNIKIYENKKLEIIKNKRFKYCPICNMKMDIKRKYCSQECSHKFQQKVERPSKEVLEEEIKNNSWVSLGKKYKVSDNAIRKWAKKYQLI